MISVYELRL